MNLTGPARHSGVDVRHTSVGVASQATMQRPLIELYRDATNREYRVSRSGLEFGQYFVPIPGC